MIFGGLKDRLPAEHVSSEQLVLNLLQVWPAKVEIDDEIMDYCAALAHEAILEISTDTVSTSLLVLSQAEPFNRYARFKYWMLAAYFSCKFAGSQELSPMAFAEIEAFADEPEIMETALRQLILYVAAQIKCGMSERRLRDAATLAAFFSVAVCVKMGEPNALAPNANVCQLKLRQMAQIDAHFVEICKMLCGLDQKLASQCAKSALVN